MRQLLHGDRRGILLPLAKSDLIQEGNPNAAASLGQVTQGEPPPPGQPDMLPPTMATKMEGGAPKIPAGVGVFDRFYKKQAAELGQRRDMIADPTGQVGPVTAEDAAHTVLQGIGDQGGWLTRFKSQKDQLYNRVYNGFDQVQTRGF